MGRKILIAVSVIFIVILGVRFFSDPVLPEDDYIQEGYDYKLPDPEYLPDGLFGDFLKAQAADPNAVSFLNFGDAMFDRGVEIIIGKGKNPFEHINTVETNFLKGIDFITVNLEGPITSVAECQQKSFSFKFDPYSAEMLLQGGINMANLANNHSFDCWDEGLKETRDYLSQSEIGYFGGNTLEESYTTREVKGQKIVFVGIDQTLGKIKIEDFYSLIRELNEENNFVVVNIHWGNEYEKSFSVLQKEVGRKLIDNGADVIIGHHPHVVEPMEIYKNKPIFYSLGNFIFDQSDEGTTEGLGVGFILNGQKNNFFVFPYKIENYIPKFLPDNEADKFCADFLNGIQSASLCQFNLAG